MKRVIIQFLLCSVLFSGVAWAADSDAEAFFGHASEILHDADMHPQHDDDHSESDDHCCHGAAHLLGMANIAISSVDHFNDRDAVAVSLAFRSKFHSPPTHVPI